MPERVCLAILIRPRGLKGELAAEPGGDWQADELLRFEGLYLHPSDRPVRLEHAWHQKDRLVLKFEGIDTIEQAELVRGQELSMPGEARPPAPEGEFYVGDLTGCRVIHFSSGEEIGTVTQCLDYGGPLLLEVSCPRGQILIPFANAICREVDVPGKRIVVDPPEGLLDV